MLLRIVPFAAVILTLAAILSAGFWQPHDKSGLFSPAHLSGGTS